MFSHMTKNHSLAVCHAFKIGSNFIGTAEVILSEKYSAIQTTSAICLKKNYLLACSGLRFRHYNLANLKWNEHVTECIKKTNKSLYFIVLFNGVNVPLHLFQNTAHKFTIMCFRNILALTLRGSRRENSLLFPLLGYLIRFAQLSSVRTHSCQTCCALQ